MAQIYVIGRITAEPELKTSQKNTPYMRFNLAENPLWQLVRIAELQKKTGLCVKHISKRMMKPKRILKVFTPRG